jgi:hypothetical protein
MSTGTVVLPEGQELSDAMGYLLASSAPSRWGESVRRAARLVAPTWTGSTVDLATLALVLYVLAREDGRTEVLLDAAREAVSGSGPSAEPVSLRARIEASLVAEGHLRHDAALRSTTSPLWRIYQALARRWEPSGEPVSDLSPGPSDLRHAAERLAGTLRGVTDDQFAELPDAPQATGPLEIRVEGGISLVYQSAGVGALMPLRCPDCGPRTGGVLRVDGPDVTYTCPDCDLASTHRDLSAAHVRTALSCTIETASSTPTPAAGIQGVIQVRGDLVVCEAEMPSSVSPIG